MFLRNIILPFSALVVLIFVLYHSQNFKLDASSDTLILQNDDLKQSKVQKELNILAMLWLVKTVL